MDQLSLATTVKYEGKFEARATWKFSLEGFVSGLWGGDEDDAQLLEELAGQLLTLSARVELTEGVASSREVLLLPDNIADPQRHVFHVLASKPPERIKGARVRSRDALRREIDAQVLCNVASGTLQIKLQVPCHNASMNTVETVESLRDDLSNLLTGCADWCVKEENDSAPGSGTAGVVAATATCGGGPGDLASILGRGLASFASGLDVLKVQVQSKKTGGKRTSAVKARILASRGDAVATSGRGAYLALRIATGNMLAAQAHIFDVRDLGYDYVMQI